MKTVEGDLIALALEGAFDVVVHGCNCHGTMGAGIAQAIARTFPEALAADRATPAGDRAKLGTISAAETLRADRPLTIVNAYTQFHWRGPGRKADYAAIDACFGEIAAGFPEARIGYPLIGAGLAGGDWDEIAPIIDRRLAGLDHTLVRFVP
ncbi:MAG: macro domain-containing protein [Pseudomonadota bacterium]